MPHDQPVRSLRTTWIFACLAAVTSLLVLAACGGGSGSDADAVEAPPAASVPAPSTGESTAPAAAPAETGPWIFTDDVGSEVTLEEPPVRIVAEAESARALFELGITPVGIFGPAPLDQLAYLDPLPLEKIESLGEVWGEINLEKLAAVDPDLVVTAAWPPEAILWGFKDDKQQARIAEIAPLVGIDSRSTATRGIGRYADLAASLGADTESAELVEAKAQFEAASEALRTAVAAKPGLRVLPISGTPDGLYVAVAPNFPDLAYLSELGVEFVKPANPDDDYWETLSWEEAGKYPADVVLVDARVWADSEGAPEDAFAGVATWKDLPAVQAGQTGPWRAGAPLAYSTYAKNIEELTALIERSEIVAP